MRPFPRAAERTTTRCQHVLDVLLNRHRVDACRLGGLDETRKILPRCAKPSQSGIRAQPVKQVVQHGRIGVDTRRCRVLGRHQPEKIRLYRKSCRRGLDHRRAPAVHSGTRKFVASASEKLRERSLAAGGGTAACSRSKRRVRAAASRAPVLARSAGGWA